MRNDRRESARIEGLKEKPRRVFGALRGAVHTDPSFFEPLPVAELDAWEGTSKKRRAPSAQQELAASLRAFWVIAEDWNLTVVEQCAVLSVSASTLSMTAGKIAERILAIADALDELHDWCRRQERET